MPHLSKQSVPARSAKKQKNDHGQYFTPPGVAEAMVGLLRNGRSAPVLEPSCGLGVFLHALRRAGYTVIEGVEIDDSLEVDKDFTVHHESFISWSTTSKFSSIIGNPPYIRWKNLAEIQQLEVKSHKLWGDLFNSLSDYLTVFIANSVEHLLDGGELVFITPSFWMGTKHSSGLREWLLQRGSFSDLVTFGESEVFPGVASSIVIFRFVKGKSGEEIRRFTFIGGNRVPEEIDFFDGSQFFIDSIPHFRPGFHWTIATSEEQEVANALEACCIVPDPNTLFDEPRLRRLGEFVDIANGMVSGLDKAFRIQEEEVGLLNPVEKKALLRVVKARDLSVGVPHRVSRYIDVPLGLDEHEFRTQFPYFYDRLNAFRDELLARYSYGRDLPFWEWAFRRSEAFLTSSKDKGFVPCKERLTNRERVRFAKVGGGVVATQDMTAFVPKEGVRESLDYILGYLLTRPVSDWIRLRGLMKGGVAEFSEKPLSEIPFRSIDWRDRKDVELHDNVARVFQNGARSGDLSSAISEIELLFRQAASRPLR